MTTARTRSIQIDYSFYLDLSLIATTAKILFQKENTEGVEIWQKTAVRTPEKDASVQEQEEDNE